MTVTEIKDFVENYFQIDLTDKKRKHEIVRIRFLYYYYAYNYTSNYSAYNNISSLIGFTHASAYRGKDEFLNFTRYNKPFDRMVKEFDLKFMEFYNESTSFDNENYKFQKYNFLTKRIESLQEELANLK